MRLKNTYCIFACLLLVCNASAQSPGHGSADAGSGSTQDSIIKDGPPPSPALSGIPKRFADVAAQYPEEKVHLHLDREKYFAGDTIWFKNYMFLGGLPGKRSKILHVDLYRDTMLVESKIYPVDSAGELELAPNLPDGIYTIQAYTPWMANFDHSHFYHYTFPLCRPHSTIHVSTAAAVEPTVRKFDIQFLPEGGSAVNGITSRVSFAAIDDRGQVLENVEGWIADESGDTVAHFHSIHDGMGTFTYFPRKGKTYYAHVLTSIGSKEIKIRPANDDGVGLQAKLVPGGVQVWLRATSHSAFLNNSLMLVGTMYGNPVYKANAFLTEDVRIFSGIIPTDSVANGILRISVIYKDSTVAERVVFVQPRQLAMQPELKFTTLSGEQRALNSWTLHFPDSVHGSLSVSVTDADALPRAQSRSNIFSDLLLTEDEDTSDLRELRGHVHNPAWYFENGVDSAFRTEALDLVMLTHGWRTLTWQQVHKPESLPIIRFPLEQSMVFSGHVYYGTGKKLVRNKELNLVIQSPRFGTQVMTVQVDSSGRFRIENLEFSDSVSAYFQVNEDGDKAKNIRLQMDAPVVLSTVSSHHLDSISRPSVAMDSVFQVWASKKADMDSAIRRYMNAKELKQIFIKGKNRERVQLEELDERYTFGMFSNGDGFQFDLVHHPEYRNNLNLFSFLQGRVPSLTLKGAFPRYTFCYRGGGSPALYLNELPASAEQINDIPISLIAYVKFIYPPFMGAYLGGSNGAIAVYIRRGDDLLSDCYGLNEITLKGYNSSREFYSPLYSGESDAQSSSEPDYRLTLNWQPNILLNESNQYATIKFYNNDHSRHFRIVAEGMDNSGKLLHFEEVVNGLQAYSNSVATGQ